MVLRLISSRVFAPPVASLRLLPRRCLTTREVGAANRRVTDADELRRTVDGWRRPHTPGPLTPAELEAFFRDGFVTKHGLLKDADIDPVIGAVEKLVDDVAKELHAAGRIRDPCADADFFTRLTKIEAQFPSASVLLHKRGVLPPAVARLWSSQVLLDAAEQVLGPDVAGHPVWNLRTKTPNQMQATVPWHQDIAYLDESCWSTLQLTAWIPLLDTNTQNGCMQVIRGGHRTGRAAHHTCCVGGTWYVELPEDEMVKTLECDIQRDLVTCEVPKGSVLFLNNLIPHRSLNNASDKIRWSFDLRWQRSNEPDGFYGIKPVIPMRRAGDPNYKIKWEGWAELQRNLMQEEKVRGQARAVVDEVKAEDKIDEQFDTTIVGPWMMNWPLVNHNRHTARLKQEGLQNITKA